MRASLPTGIRVAPFIIGLLWLAQPAQAEVSSATAKQLYDEGLTNYNLGHYERALSSFEQGYRVKHDPAFLFNIGQCQRQLHRYNDAELSYRAYLRESPDLTPEVREQVQKLINEMKKAVEDERSRMPPPGMQPPAPAVTLPVASPSRDESIRYADAGRSLRIAGIVVADTGVALVALGVVFAVLSKQAGDDAYRPATKIYDPTADDRQKNYRAADIASFVVGGAAVVTGAALWLVGRNRRHTKMSAGVAAFPGSASLKVAF
jgi:tetratricopeptide (TPR) repeat protein